MEPYFFDEETGTFYCTSAGIDRICADYQREHGHENADLRGVYMPIHNSFNTYIIDSYMELKQLIQLVIRQFGGFSFSPECMGNPKIGTIYYQRTPMGLFQGISFDGGFGKSNQAVLLASVFPTTFKSELSISYMDGIDMLRQKGDSFEHPDCRISTAGIWFEGDDNRGIQWTGASSSMLLNHLELAYLSDLL